MSDITLEKVDIIRERTGVSYGDAKKALEICDGNVVDALIYIEENMGDKVSQMSQSAEDFIEWIKSVVNKGNVTRIKIRKDDKVIVDVPVNAGIAAGVIAAIWPPIMAIGILTAVFTKVTVEITRDDGSVEVVNTIIQNKTEGIREKLGNMASTVKDKFDIKANKEPIMEEPIYKYTVKFDDMENVDKEENNESN